MQIKLYLSTIAIGCGGFLIFFFILSTQMEPYSGSGTRMGGFLERDYGWNAAQTYFSKPLFKVGKSITDYAEPVDLLVLGDSFSYDVKKSWINYVVRNYGISVMFLHIDKVAISELLAHRVFRESPPQFLILQSTEGLSLSRFNRLKTEIEKAKEIPRQPQNRTSVTLSTLNKNNFVNVETYAAYRDKALTFNKRMAITGDYLIKWVKRFVFGERLTNFRALHIDCDTCFSNSKQHYFLVSASSLDPIAYKFNLLDSAINNLKLLKAIVEENGYSRFFTISFPLKINVYLSFTGIEKNPTLFDKIKPDMDIGFINLFPSLLRSVNDGVQDVYLPNDHHMGSAGYAIAADVIANTLFSDSATMHE